MNAVARIARRRTRRGRSTLSVVGGFLLGSALLRLAMGAGDVVAQAAQAADESGQDGAVAEGPTPLSEGNKLLEALARRDARIAEREAALDIRAQALKLAETEIEKRLDVLAEAEAKLRQTLDAAYGASARDVAQLTDVYANMKPREAAALFAEMDPEFAAGFLARMKPEQAAAILAGLPPRNAYTISVMLAGRNADVPTE
ncbi:MotE family protein [Litorisediminicola beolgyonensis]|uniref:MotE family protein n=1 Tax=Litorisediminicola beolgyonensis TaxID=1173614 RepID=A0ABW3ZM77_9RHOB